MRFDLISIFIDLYYNIKVVILLFNIKKTEKNLQIYIIIHTKYIKVKYKI